jgi:hypothetical protein
MSCLIPYFLSISQDIPNLFDGIVSSHCSASQADGLRAAKHIRSDQCGEIGQSGEVPE